MIGWRKSAWHQFPQHHLDLQLFVCEGWPDSRWAQSFLCSELVRGWYSAEAPSCCGSSQWIFGCVDNKPGVRDLDESHTGEEEERDCAEVLSVACSKGWTMMELWERNSNLTSWAKHTCRLYCAVTVHVKMWRAAGLSGVRQVYLSTLSVDCQGIHFPASEKNSEKTVQSRVRIAKKFNFHHWFEEDECVGFRDKFPCDFER